MIAKLNFVKIKTFENAIFKIILSLFDKNYFFKILF